MKICLICGHGASDPGACSSYGVEATETRRVVAEMVNQFKRYKGVEVDVYPTNRNAYADVKNGCVQVNFANYDYCYEVHFNSASASANGVEVWVTPNETGTSVEQNIVDKVASLGFTNRGVKKEYFAVITSAKNKGTSSALVEVCFISNQEDMAKYNSKFTQVCGAMVDGIAEGFGLAKNETQSQQPTNTNNKIEERRKVKGIVIYSNDIDRRAAEYLADSKGLPTISSSTSFDYSTVDQNGIYAVGGARNTYTSYLKDENFISGKDRYETVKEVLRRIGRL